MEMESETEVGHEDLTVTCPCGERFWLFYNGGELDQRTCKCGRIYELEARHIFLVVRKAA